MKKIYTVGIDLERILLKQEDASAATTPRTALKKQNTHCKILMVRTKHTKGTRQPHNKYVQSRKYGSITTYKSSVHAGNFEYTTSTDAEIRVDYFLIGDDQKKKHRTL